MRTVAALMGLMMLNCGAYAYSTAWEPHSMRAGSGRIAREAVRIGPGDVDEIRAAGGVPHGALTMKGDSLGDIDIVAAKEAADLGGTHYMLGEWREASTAKSYWAVATATAADHEARYVVIRVPREAWGNLHGRMRPIPAASK